MTQGQIPDAPTVGGIEIPTTEGLHAANIPDTAEILDIIEGGGKAFIVGLYDPGGSTTAGELRIAGKDDVLPDTHSYTYIGNFSLGGPTKLVFRAHPV